MSPAAEEKFFRLWVTTSCNGTIISALAKAFCAGKLAVYREVQPITFFLVTNMTNVGGTKAWLIWKRWRKLLSGATATP